MQLKREYLYCVAQKSGHLCLWSIATNRAGAWLRFRLGSVFFQGMTVQEARKHAQAEGCRCVRLHVTLANAAA